MKYIIILYLSSFTLFQACSNGESDGTEKLDEYIKIEFTSGPLAGSKIDGNAGISIVQQLKSLDSYSTNLLLGLDTKTITNFQLSIDHEGNSPGTYSLSDQSNPISAEGNQIKISPIEKLESAAMHSTSGEMTISSYDSIYEGKFKGSFVDTNENIHTIEGSFKIEI